MLRHAKEISQAFSIVFATWRYRTLAAAATLVFAGVSLFVPVWLIPSNTLALELSLMRPENYAALAALSMASGALIAVNMFLVCKWNGSMGAAAGGGAGIFASLGGAILLTSCGCGLGFVIGVLGVGVGGTSFLLANQSAIAFVALGLVLYGLYSGMRRAAGVCEVCALGPINNASK